MGRRSRLRRRHPAPGLHLRRRSGTDRIPQIPGARVLSGPDLRHQRHAQTDERHLPRRPHRSHRRLSETAAAAPNCPTPTPTRRPNGRAKGLGGGQPGAGNSKPNGPGGSTVFWKSCGGEIYAHGVACKKGRKVIKGAAQKLVGRRTGQVAGFTCHLNPAAIRPIACRRGPRPGPGPKLLGRGLRRGRLGRRRGRLGCRFGGCRFGQAGSRTDLIGFPLPDLVQRVLDVGEKGG